MAARAEVENREEVKVSVIVPVYNGEKHLRQCLDSICAQTLREIEIICVDDGSTDYSLAILREYQEKDARIQIYQQPNLHAGIARNTGMAYATGEYLVFWDCDDFFELDALEKLYEKAVSVRADICVCRANRYYERHGKSWKNVPGSLNVKMLPEQEVFNRSTCEDTILNFTGPEVWNKIFRLEFIGRIGLKFPELRAAEDTYFTVIAICLADRITTLDESLVTYRTDQEESTVTGISQFVLDPLGALVSMAERLKKERAFPEKSFANMAIGNMIFVLRNIRSYGAFEQAVNYLRGEALQKVGITKERNEGFYLSGRNWEYAQHLLHDTPAELQTYFSYLSYTQLSVRNMEKSVLSRNYKASQRTIRDLKNSLTHEKKKLAKCQDDIEKIQHSVSFRIGRAVTWLPRKIRNLFHR